MTQVVATGGVVTPVGEYGEYTSHTFNTSGTFTVTAGGTIEYLVIAGGGGGPSGGGGGGGAGGLLFGTATVSANTSYTITVGAGGAGGVGTNQVGFNGEGSSISGTDVSVNATGGGRGGIVAAPSIGGSGGGAGRSGAAGASGIAGQGYAGGNTSGNNSSGGGGGAGGAGQNKVSSSTSGAGGIGVESSITGIATYYAGGGGGSGYSGGGAAIPGAGGLGGGGSGGAMSGAVNGISGTAYTGGGGGAGSYTNTSHSGGAGGSGIIILRYLTNTAVTFKKNGNTVYEANEGDTVTVSIISDTTATGTVNYTLSGISSADINDASLTGSVSLTNYEASFDIVITNDVSTGEGVETLTVSVVDNGTTYTANLPINDSSATPVVASGGEYNFLPSGHALHVFKTSGTFTVTDGGTIEYLVIAGGGGGGSDMGGGGGAGGYLAGSMTVAAGTYNILVGAGGSGAPAGIGQVRGYNGENTVAIGLTAFGGGGGASQHNGAAAPAGNGGSGGGGSGGRLSGNSSYGGLNGTGTTGQGNDGAYSGNSWYPGGGGGAGAAAVQTGTLVAHGGIGIENSILGTSYYWAAGGGGGGYTTYGGDGGLGGGGGGAPRGTSGFGGGSALNSGSDAEVGLLTSQTNKKGGSAGANTGSGGGGGSHYNAANDGGNGGSGIVILRYTSPLPIVGLYQTGSDLRIVLNSLGGSTPGASQPNGTVVPYTISGNYITEDKIGNPLTGNFVLTDNTDEITISVGTIPNTTLVFTAFGETVSYELIFPATLVGDVSYLDSTLVLGNYNTLVVQSILNGIPMPLGDTEWVSNGALANYKTLTLPPTDLAEVVPYRFTTVSGGGRMNTFTIKPLGAEIINETWY